MKADKRTDQAVNLGPSSTEELIPVKRLDLSLSLWDAEAILKATETILEEVLGLKRRLEEMKEIKPISPSEQRPVDVEPES